MVGRPEAAMFALNDQMDNKRMKGEQNEEEKVRKNFRETWIWTTIKVG